MKPGSPAPWFIIAGFCLCIIVVNLPHGSDDHVYATNVASTPQASATASPTAKPTPKGSRKDAVEAYYKALDAKKYETAYAMLSAAAQKRHSYADFLAYQSAISATEAMVLGQQGEFVRVSVAELHNNDPNNAKIFDGGWRVVPSANGQRWLLDNGEFSLPSTVAMAPTPSPVATDNVMSRSDTVTTQQASTTTVDGNTQSSEVGTTTQPESPSYEPATFHGYLCKESSCSGHIAGYNWAQEKGIDDPHTCYHGARLSNPKYESFSEGCEAYVDDATGDARLDPSDRYSDDGSGTQSDP